MGRDLEGTVKQYVCDFCGRLARGESVDTADAIPVGAHPRIYSWLRRCLTLKDLGALTAVDRSYPEFCAPLLEEHEPEREPQPYGPPPSPIKHGHPVGGGGNGEARP